MAFPTATILEKLQIMANYYSVALPNSCTLNNIEIIYHKSILTAGDCSFSVLAYFEYRKIKQNQDIDIFLYPA